MAGWEIICFYSSEKSLCIAFLSFRSAFLLSVWPEVSYPLYSCLHSRTVMISWDYEEFFSKELGLFYLCAWHIRTVKSTWTFSLCHRWGNWVREFQTPWSKRSGDRNRVIAAVFRMLRPGFNGAQPLELDRHQSRYVLLISMRLSCCV